MMSLGWTQPLSCLLLWVIWLVFWGLSFIGNRMWSSGQKPMPSRQCPVPQFLFLKDILPRNERGHTCEGTLNMQESIRKGTSFWSPRCCVAGMWPAPGRTGHVAAPWEVTKSRKRSSKVKLLGVQRKDRGSRFTLHQSIVASLIRRRFSLKRTETVIKFYPPPPCLPLFRENSISCVGISFSVNISKITWEVNLRIWVRIGS